MPRSPRAVCIGGVTVAPGQHSQIELPVAKLPTRSTLALPIEVVNGNTPGPTVWLSASLHGDEANGVEVIRQVMERVRLTELSGTLISVPIANVFGFLTRSRYLPDRRDLNRSFPGSPKGSLASRIAHQLMTEVIGHCSHGIDLHTGSDRRYNYPQIRADLEDRATLRFAQAFAAPVIMHAKTRDGSLRAAATKRNIKVLVYEGGEVLRFNRTAIDQGVHGILRALRYLGMGRFKARKPPISVVVRESTWVRARRGGIVRLHVQPGDWVYHREELGAIRDTFGTQVASLTSPADGIVVGISNNPLVHQGDALVHIGHRRVPRQSKK